MERSLHFACLGTHPEEQPIIKLLASAIIVLISMTDADVIAFASCDIC